MNATEIMAWIEGQQDARFRSELGYLTRRATDTWESWQRELAPPGDYRNARAILRAFLFGGLYVDGKRPDPDCLNEVINQLEREA